MEKHLMPSFRHVFFFFCSKRKQILSKDVIQHNEKKKKITKKRDSPGAGLACWLVANSRALSVQQSSEEQSKKTLTTQAVM